MSGEKLFNLFANIDEKYIQEADVIKSVKRPKMLHKIAIALILCIALSGVGVIAKTVIDSTKKNTVKTVRDIGFDTLFDEKIKEIIIRDSIGEYDGKRKERITIKDKESIQKVVDTLDTIRFIGKPKKGDTAINIEEKVVIMPMYDGDRGTKEQKKGVYPIYIDIVTDKNIYVFGVKNSIFIVGDDWYKTDNPELEEIFRELYQ